MRRLLLGVVAVLAIAPCAWAQPVPQGAEFRVNTYTTDGQGAAAVGIDSSGAFVIVWRSDGEDGAGEGVFGRRYGSAGAPLGSAFQVNTYTTYNQRDPVVATDSSGGFVVAWSSNSQDGSAYGVFGRRYDSSGAPMGGEFLVNAYTTSSQQQPAVAVDPSGDFVVIWSSFDQDGSAFGIFGRRFDSNGAPVGGDFQVNTYTTDFQQRPALAMDSSGAFVVAWSSFSQDAPGWGVFGQRYDSTGDPAGGEFQINTYTTQGQADPSVAMDPNGGFIVAWHGSDQDGSLYGVFGQRYDSAGLPLGGEFQVNTYTTGHQGGPAVAVDARGGFVVTWQSYVQDGSYPGVFGQRFESTGAPLAGEFQVNTWTTGFQGEPAVAMDPAGHFVIVWTSEDQDGSADGVFARRLCDDLDGDDLCDPEDVIVTDPIEGNALDCSDPKVVRPAFMWDPGNYEKFRVYLASDPGFAKGTRVASGDSLMTATTWTPSRKKWRSACNKALGADPNNPVLYIEIFGVDTDLPKNDAFRKTFSQIVQVDVLP